MSGDKITGFDTRYKGNADFTRTLALLALSDAMHDFKDKQMYKKDSGIENILKKGLPHIFNDAVNKDRQLTAVEEDDVIEYVFGKSQLEFFSDIRRVESSGETVPIELRLGTEMVHTHDAKVITLYDKRDKILPKINGTMLVKELDINNANLVVDLDSISFMAALKEGPVDDSKTVKYILVSESYNDPATRQGFDSSVFKLKGGIKLESLLQVGGLPLKYPAWNPAIQNHTNDLFSKYNFELSPVHEIKKGMYNVTLTVTNPNKRDSEKIKVDNPKKDNAIDAIKVKFNKLLSLFGGRSRNDDEVIYQKNVKYQQKRSGDWLQALAVQDIYNRNFINRAGQPVNIEGEVFFVTHDRIALTYALLSGCNALFTHYWKGNGRFLYYFKAKKPAPARGLVVNNSPAILLEYKTNAKESEVTSLINYLKKQESEFKTYLENYETPIINYAEQLIIKDSDENIVPNLNTIKVVLRLLSLYIYVCSSVPNYNNIYRYLENSYNQLKSFRGVEGHETVINKFNSIFNKASQLRAYNYSQFYNINKFRNSEAYTSINNVDFNTNISDYLGYNYILRNSFDGYKIFELRNHIVMRFEKALRLPYFDFIRKDEDLFLMRLLLLGITELSTTAPDPKMIQTFNDRVWKDAALKEAEIFGVTIEPDGEVADILMNMYNGYDNLISFHLQNDPIYRQNLSSADEIVRSFFPTTAGGAKAQILTTTRKVNATTRRRQSKHNPFRRSEITTLKSGQTLRRAYGSVTAYRPSVFRTGARPRFSGVGRRAGEATKSLNAIEDSISAITFYGHHPFTPLLYLQLQILTYIRNNNYDNRSPDFTVYLTLGKIINVLTVKLNEIMKGGNDSHTVLGGLILKYLLYKAIPNKKGIGDTIFPISKENRVTYMKTELTILLGLLTDPIQLQYSAAQETAFERLIARPDIGGFISKIRDELAKIKVDTSDITSYLTKTNKNIKYMYESIKAISGKAATRSLVKYVPSRIANYPRVPVTAVVGTKRGRNSDSNGRSRTKKRARTEAVVKESNYNSNL